MFERWRDERRQNYRIPSYQLFPQMARVEMGSRQLSPVLEPWPSGHTLAGNQWAEPGLTLRSRTGKDRHAKQRLGPMAHAAPALPTVGHRGWCSLPVGPHSAQTRQQAKIWRHLTPWAVCCSTGTPMQLTDPPPSLLFQVPREIVLGYCEYSHMGRDFALVFVRVYKICTESESCSVLILY